MRETITQQQLDKVCEITGAVVGEDVHTDYSGRAMYGEDCIGFVENPECSAAQFIAALAITLKGGDEDGELDDDFGPYELMEWMGEYSPRTDSMGYSTISYFPGLKLTDEAKAYYRATAEGR